MAGPISACTLFPADEFPNLVEPEGERVVLQAADLAEGLRQVVRAAAANDELRMVLTGVLLAAEGEGLRMVSTDSYRLAVRDLPGTTALRGDQQVLVPSRALNELRPCAARRLRGDPGARRSRRLVPALRPCTSRPG